MSGGWFAAPEGTLRLLIALTAVGLAVFHVTAPWSITKLIRFQVRLTIVSIVVLGAFLVGVLVLQFHPPIPPEAYVALIALWMIASTVVVAMTQGPLGPLSSVAVIGLVAVSVAAVALWWLAIYTGLLFIAPPDGATPGATRDVVSTIYASPGLAVIVPGLPTLTLAALLGAALVRRHFTAPILVDGA